jgi:hypothetical protein
MEVTPSSEMVADFRGMDSIISLKTEGFKTRAASNAVISTTKQRFSPWPDNSTEICTMFL